MTKKSDIVVSTYGFDGLEQTFKNFQYKDKRNIFINAFRKATKPTLDAARSNVPRGKTSNLYRSLGLVPMQDNIGVFIGARIIGGYRGFHGHLVEDGTVNRYVKTEKGKTLKTPRFTGKMNPNAHYAGFFRKAVEGTERQVIDTVTKEWYDAIARFIVRNGKDK
jgi:HK97 gp10 family phage protein